MSFLWGLAIFFGVMWLLGFSLHVGAGFIHILLVVAVCVVLFQLVAGRRTA
jgi:Family of unknown function (DUF5670)